MWDRLLAYDEAWAEILAYIRSWKLREDQRNLFRSAVLRISHSLENQTIIASICRDRPSMTSGVNQGNWALRKRTFYGCIFETAVKPR